jgi:diguanylate cyclase (GGDEF)-like protein/PAS domain S-box-containing protein
MSFSKDFKVRLLLGVGMLNVLVLGLAGITMRNDLLEQQARARVSSENIAGLLEYDVSAAFSRIDLVLQTVVDEVEREQATRGLDTQRLNDFLKRQRSHLPEISALRLTDERGRIRYGDGLVTPNQVIDVSDREHFVRQRDDANVGFFVGKPIMARINRQWSLPVSRRIQRADGGFAGTVFATVPVAYFTERFSQLKLGARGVVALRTADNLSVARYPELLAGGGAVGQFALSEQLRELLNTRPDRAVYVARSPVDQIERTFAYRRLAAYPLYIIVGLASRDTLAEWWGGVTVTASLALLFFLMSMLFAALLWRAWRRQWSANEALRESEQRWSMALEGGEFCVWDWDLVSGKIILSKRGKQMYGYEDDEMADDIATWQAMLHPEDLANVEADLKRYLRGDTPTHATEYRVRHKSGRWLWILSRGMVVSRDAQGQVLRMIGTHVDVTERREREEELKLAAAAFEMADEAVVVTNEHNEIVSVNPAFTAITGYEPREVLGRNPKMLSAKTHPPSFYEAMWRSLLGSGRWSGEVSNRKKSGETYVEWLSIKRMFDEQRRQAHYVAVFSDITARKAAEERMRYLALHDALTNLPNRTLFSERLGQALLRAQRDRTRLALMYFDLDKFKPVNDTYGHEVGDQLLQAVAQRVLACVRASDTVARLGGDEFVVLLPTLDQEQDALGVAEKIRQALEKPFEVAGHVFDVSTSLGLAIYPAHGEDAQTLTRHADEAMYQAKKLGRNKVVLYQGGV